MLITSVISRVAVSTIYPCRNLVTPIKSTLSSMPQTSFLLFQGDRDDSSMYLWWRWGESNSRPEVLRFEGITTISLVLLLCDNNYSTHRKWFHVDMFESLVVDSDSIQQQVGSGNIRNTVVKQ
jgi:hypothetical protein